MIGCPCNTSTVILAVASHGCTSHCDTTHQSTLVLEHAKMLSPCFPAEEYNPFGIHMTQSRYEGTNKNYLTFNLLPVSSRLLRTASHAYALHLFGLHVTRCYVKSCCGSVIMMILNLRNISVCLHTGLCLCSWSQAHFNPLLRVPISACKEMKLGIV